MFQIIIVWSSYSSSSSSKSPKISLCTKSSRFLGVRRSCETSLNIFFLEFSIILVCFYYLTIKKGGLLPPLFIFLVLCTSFLLYCEKLRIGVCLPSVLDEFFWASRRVGRFPMHLVLPLPLNHPSLFMSYTYARVAPCLHTCFFSI